MKGMETPTLTPDEFLQARRTLGLYQAALARALGVIVRTIGRWEHGDRRVPGPAVLLLRRILESIPPEK